MAHQHGPRYHQYGPGYSYPPPPPSRKTNSALLVLGIVGAALLVLAGGCVAVVAVIGSGVPAPRVITDTAPPIAQADPAIPPDPVSPVEQPPPAGQGDETQPSSAPVAVGGTITLQGNDPGLMVAVTVTKVVPQATPSNQFLHPKTGFRYVAIELQLHNVGQAVYDDFPSNGADLIDDQGQQYSSTFGEVAEGVKLSSVSVTTGDTRKGVILFEVPEQVRLAKFQFGLNSGFARQKGEWMIA